jgi:hypothetical protein
MSFGDTRHMSSLRRSFTLVTVMSVAAVGLFGCPPRPGTHDPGYVAKEWATTFREFGIVPVFPPREDIQVGDVYAMPLPPDSELQLRAVRSTDGRFLPIPILLASVDYKADLEAFYQSRFSFPATPNSIPATQPNVFPQPTSQGNQTIFATGAANRLRLGGFPEFFSTQISQGGIGGLVPTEAVNIAFGALGSANKRVRVSVPMIESYGLPAGRVLAKISQTSSGIRFGGPGTPAGGEATITAAQLTQLLHPAGGTDPKTAAQIEEANAKANAKGYLVLITEVYATRSIDISVEAETSRAGGLNLQPTAELLKNLPGFATTKPSTQPAATLVPTTQATAAQFEVATPAQIAAAMTNQLNEQLAATTPGVNVKFVSVTAFGVSMRRTYERPIVIGYRGIVYKVGKDDQLTIAGSASGAVPVKGGIGDLQPRLPQIQDAVAGRVKSVTNAAATVAITFVPDRPGSDRVGRALVKITPAPTEAQRTAVEAAVRDEVQKQLEDPNVTVVIVRE